MSLPNLTIEGATPAAAWIPTLDDDGDGTTTLTDLTGNGYDGTLTSMDAGTDWVDEGGGLRYLDFDGINDHVTDFGYTFAEDGNFSASVWIYPTTIAGANKNIYGVQSSADTGGRFLRINSGKLDFRVVSTVDIYAATDTTNVDVDAWTHVVIVLDFDSSEIRLYRNTSEVASASISGTVGARGNTTIGKRPDAASNYFTGRIDDVRQFESVLTTGQIAALYARGAGRGITGGSPAPLSVFESQAFNSRVF